MRPPPPTHLIVTIIGVTAGHYICKFLPDQFVIRVVGSFFSGLCYEGILNRLPLIELEIVLNRVGETVTTTLGGWWLPKNDAIQITSGVVLQSVVEKAVQMPQVAVAVGVSANVLRSFVSDFSVSVKGGSVYYSTKSPAFLKMI